MQFEESQTQSLIDSKIMEFAQHARPPMVCNPALPCRTEACHAARASVLSAHRPAAEAKDDPGLPCRLAACRGACHLRALQRGWAWDSLQ